jgi:hypothetical protein
MRHGAIIEIAQLACLHDGYERVAA